MADLTVNAARVTHVGGTGYMVQTAGATITRGQVVSRVSADNNYVLADANVEAQSVVAGIALSDGYDGSLFILAPPGAVIDFGGNLTAGDTYILSDTAGAVADESDAGSGWYKTVLAVGQGTREAEILTNEPGLVP